MAENLKIQNRYILQPEKSYVFKPDVYCECANQLLIGNILKHERKQNSIYPKAYSFKKRAVKTIRGPKTKGLLMPIPASPEDKITLKGMKIMLDMLQQCLIGQGIVERRSQARAAQD
jgi:hypothetical protein